MSTRRIHFFEEPAFRPISRVGNEFNATNFVWCPMSGLPGGAAAAPDARQALYQWAFEQAQAVARPSWVERDPLGVWN
jgi:hypothetical protein